MLEIGCGRHAKWLRGVAPQFGHAIGLDFEIAAQSDAENGYMLCVGDAHHLPVRTGSVDVIVSANVLEHLADLNDALPNSPARCGPVAG